MSADLRAGIYEHYKHQLYRLEGVALYGGNPTDHDWEAMALKGVAHYSEDPAIILLVAAVEGLEPVRGSGLFYFRIGAKSAPQPTPQTSMVYYTALHAAPEDDDWTPRQCLRPVSGPEGWTTPKYVKNLKREVERFRFVKDPSRLPPLAERHDWGHGLGHKSCQRCGLTTAI